MLDATSNCRYENLFMFTCEINDYVDMKPILANIHLSYVEMRDKYICTLFMLTREVIMLHCDVDMRDNYIYLTN